mmetsp:Transcript_23/g.72  ORF Transcript_23/g.72 Transcript_23/m.72 type:complete len:98 (+) Transcript_23:408-701(+)
MKSFPPDDFIFNVYCSPVLSDVIKAKDIRFPKFLDESITEFNSGAVFFSQVLPFLRNLVNNIDVFEGRKRYTIFPPGGIQPSIYLSRDCILLKIEKD